MFWLVKNRTARVVLSLGAAFAIGMLIFGGMRSLVGPTGVLLVNLAAMPILAYGYYLQFSALARHMEAAEEA
jgi:hypothetical protein